jgi:hypothetical protein
MTDSAFQPSAKADLDGLLPPYGYVVAVPERRNYLSHIADVGGVQNWASRYVVTLCGLPMLAREVGPTDTSHRDGDGHRVERRHCERCERKASQ